MRRAATAAGRAVGGKLGAGFGDGYAWARRHYSGFVWRWQRLGYVGGKLLAGGGNRAQRRPQERGQGTGLASGSGVPQRLAWLSAGRRSGSLALQGGVLNEIGQDRERWARTGEANTRRRLAASWRSKLTMRWRSGGCRSSARQATATTVIAAMLTTLESTFSTSCRQRRRSQTSPQVSQS